MAQDGSMAKSPEIAEACLQAIAIGLGGYPRSPEQHSPRQRDSISDGVARGLGYTTATTWKPGLRPIQTNGTAGSRPPKKPSQQSTRPS